MEDSGMALVRVVCNNTSCETKTRGARRESLGAKSTGMRYKVHARASTGAASAACRGRISNRHRPVLVTTFELREYKRVPLCLWKRRRTFASLRSSMRNSFPRAYRFRSIVTARTFFKLRQAWKLLTLRLQMRSLSFVRENGTANKIVTKIYTLSRIRSIGC